MKRMGWKKYILLYDTDITANGIKRQCLYILAVDKYLAVPVFESIESRQQVAERSLAAARRTYKCKLFTCLNGQINIFQYALGGLI